MTLEVIQKYVEGVLKKWFPTKKTIIDKLSKNDDGNLTFDGKQVARFDSVNVYTESILPSPLTITPEGASAPGLSVAYTTQLSQAIEDYAWAEVRCHWNTGGGTKYYHNHTIETKTNGKSQWISQYWSGGTVGSSGGTNTALASHNGIVIGVQGKTFDVKFSDLSSGTLVIDDIIGYKLREVTDGTQFAHEHNNQTTLDLLSHNGDVLSFNNKPINTTSYKKVLWEDSIITTGSNKTVNRTLSLDESVLKYDATVFYFRLAASNGVNYYHSETNHIVETGKNLWFSKYYSSSQGVFGNYTINAAGNIILETMGQEGFSGIELYKIEGIKYNK